MTKPFSVAEDLVLRLGESLDDVIDIGLDNSGIEIRKRVSRDSQDTITEFHVWDRSQ